MLDNTFACMLSRKPPLIVCVMLPWVAEDEGMGLITATLDIPPLNGYIIPADGAEQGRAAHLQQPKAGNEPDAAHAGEAASGQASPAGHEAAAAAGGNEAATAAASSDGAPLAPQGAAAAPATGGEATEEAAADAADAAAATAALAGTNGGGESCGKPCPGGSPPQGQAARAATGPQAAVDEQTLPSEGSQASSTNQGAASHGGRALKQPSPQTELPQAEPLLPTSEHSDADAANTVRVQHSSMAALPLDGQAAAAISQQALAKGPAGVSTAQGAG